MSEEKEKINLGISKESLEIFKNLTIFIISMAIIMISGLVIFVPSLKKTLRDREKLNKTKDELSQLTKKASFLEGIDFYAIKKKQSNVEETLPTEKDVEKIFRNLRILAGEAGVVLGSIEVAPGEISTPGAGLKEKDSKDQREAKKTEKKKKDIEIIDYQVKARGKFENLKNFFDKVHSCRPVMAIGGISLSLPNDPEQSIPVSLTIKTYVQKHRELPSETGASLPQLTEEEGEVYRERVLKLTGRN